MRVIGIRHRVKRNKENEAKPTQVTVLENGKYRHFNLADETAELDFVKGKLPKTMRPVEKGEEIFLFSPHSCEWRKLKKDEKPEDFPAGWTRQGEGKTWEVVAKVPAAYEGLQPSDTVVMVLGGSGDYLAFALSRRGEQINALVRRVPSSKLKEFRGDDNKDDDSANLIKMFLASPELFQEATLSDRNLIQLRIKYVQRQEAMKERMAYEQRLFQWLIGSKFTEETDLYIEGEAKKPYGKKKEKPGILESWARGDISYAYESAKKLDKVLQALVAEENARSRELEKHLKTLDVYTKLLANVEGCGPKIAARLIVAIGDPRRFQDSLRPDGKITTGKAKIKSYCGSCPDSEGKFKRRRTGQVANWKEDARQALYLLADQFNRRPESVWGKVLLNYKAKLRLAHPDVICKDCSQDDKLIKWDDCPDKKHHKRAYNNGHIHKMASWSAVTKFLEWFYREWIKLENNQPGLSLMPEPDAEETSSTSASAQDSATA